MLRGYLEGRGEERKVFKGMEELECQNAKSVKRTIVASVSDHDNVTSLSDVTLVSESVIAFK